jgi:hypothetical protein
MMMFCQISMGFSAMWEERAAELLEHLTAELLSHDFR